jgi:trans-AT polyketide synthase/acyltransferase/oxidoreductase domain-containing protein
VRVTGSHQIEAFLRPPPGELVEQLLRTGQLTSAEARDARRLPVATDIYVQPEPDGGPAAGLLLPVLRAVRDASHSRDGHAEPVPVGVGGIGTPEEIATAVLLGADFLVTGTINACTPQARTSEAVKGLLAEVTMDDTVLAPSAELFRLGGREHLVRRATLFPARAAHLYRLYLARTPLSQLSPETRQVLESDYFGEPLDRVLSSEHGQEPQPGIAELLARYFGLGARAASRGQLEQQLNWHIPCGPEMGAFNLAAGKLGLAGWHERDVAVVAERLSAAGAQMLDRRLREVLRRADKLAGAAAHS